MTGINTVFQWIVDSWNEIPSDMVIRSNSIDGTEDDELFSEFFFQRQR